MMLFRQGCCFIQSLHFSFVLQRRLYAEFKAVSAVPLQPSGWRVILFGHSNVQASSVRTMRTFHLDLPLCREASNCFSLHLSRRRPVFDHLWDFFSKHRYGKTTATVWMMCVPIQTSSFIRQVVHSKSRRPDVSLHGSDVKASYMEIACIRSTVQTTNVMIWTRQVLIWKLRLAKVQPSER
jgi:hypothetical protein